MSCTEIQQQLAWGAPLSREQRVHAAECPHCLKVATEYSLLEQTICSMAAHVPEAFADRVMSQVLGDVTPDNAAGFSDWLSKRWVQFALVYGAAIVAAVNLVRFFAAVLTTTVGLGAVQ